ncbi:sulfurtransferase complex subunit TusB [Ramlibacter sp. AN1133]|uniref:sulfurtransferase complex subunit TusB n=1 Tax=Ramlibacter sp. AN1133 TaxID=3133429 RepID=UPI0030BA2E56
MLHIVNKSPEQARSLQSCLRVARPGDVLLLIEDAVYAATAPGAMACGLDQALRRLQVRVLLPDLEARGMAARRIAGIEPTDYGGFVDLVAAHPAHQSWL